MNCPACCTLLNIPAPDDYPYMTSIAEATVVGIDALDKSLCDAHRALYDEVAAMAAQRAPLQGVCCRIGRMGSLPRPDAAYLIGLADTKARGLEAVVGGLCKDHHEMYEGGVEILREEEEKMRKELS